MRRFTAGPWTADSPKDRAAAMRRVEDQMAGLKNQWHITTNEWGSPVIRDISGKPVLRVPGEPEQANEVARMVVHQHNTYDQLLTSLCDLLPIAAKSLSTSGPSNYAVIQNAQHLVGTKMEPMDARWIPRQAAQEAQGEEIDNQAEIDASIEAHDRQLDGAPSWARDALADEPKEEPNPLKEANEAAYNRGRMDFRPDITYEVREQMLFTIIQGHEQREHYRRGWRDACAERDRIIMTPYHGSDAVEQWVPF